MSMTFLGAAGELDRSDGQSTQTPLGPSARVAVAVVLCALAAASVAPLAGVSRSPDGPQQFSVERAAVHVKALAGHSRAIGTPGHAAAAEYITAQLRSLGLAPQHQRAVGAHRLGLSRLDLVRVDNIAARIGQSGGPAVLLVAHYDSVPFGPGAADNAAAVATLLETSRVLASGPSLRHDVIVLFTDGEEAYQDGARAFVNAHPWAADVDVALNFDARGNRGAVLMFETGTGNATVIDVLSRTAPAPSASSVFPEIYRLMPNTTDFTVLKSAGIGGLNFANIGGVQAYHSPLDEPARLDQAVLRQQGSYAVALARGLADRPLPLERHADAAYFDMFGRWLIVVPSRWMRPWAAAIAVAWLALIVWTRRGAHLSIIRVLAGATAVPLAAAITGLTVWGARGAHLIDGSGDDRLFVMALLLIPVAVVLMVDGLLFRHLSTIEIAMANLAWMALAAGAMVVRMPGAAYVWLIPLTTALAAVAFRERWPGASTPLTAGVLVTAAAPVLVLMLPVAMLIVAGLTVRAAGVVTAAVVPFAGALIQPLRAIAQSRRTRIGVVLTLVAAAIFGWRATAAEPGLRFDHLFYVLDADRGRAIWASLDATPDEWTRQFVGTAPAEPTVSLLPSRNGRWLVGPAPVAALDAPTATVLDDSVGGTVHTRTLRVVSPRLAGLVSLRFDDSARRAIVDGEALDAPGGPWQIDIRHPGPEGITVVVETTGVGPLSLIVVDQTYGLDQLPGLPSVRRPLGLLPRPMALSDAVLVTRSFTF